MKILKIKEIEDCFDGSFIKEVLFDEDVTREFIYHLGQAGELEYFPDFSRPFYKVHVPGKYIVKGVEGNQTARIILYRENIDECQLIFEQHINDFQAPITR